MLLCVLSYMHSAITSYKMASETIPENVVMSLWLQVTEIIMRIYNNSLKFLNKIFCQIV